MTARLCTAQAEAAGLRAEVVAERVRRERLEQSPPVRLLKRLRDLPGLGWIQARRTRGYDRALAAARGNDPWEDGH